MAGLRSFADEPVAEIVQCGEPISSIAYSVFLNHFERSWFNLGSIHQEFRPDLLRG
jgi:hypothetical protein